MQDDQFCPPSDQESVESNDLVHQDLSAQTIQLLNQENTTANTQLRPRNERRRFFKQAGGAIAAATLGALGLKSAAHAQQSDGFLMNRAISNEIPPGLNVAARISSGNLSGWARADRAFQIRLSAAWRQRTAPIPDNQSNGDESRYQNKNYFASFSKGLRHNEFGEVEPEAYRALVSAINSGEFAAFENLREFQGCTDAARQRPFVNPLAGNAYDLEGSDAGQLWVVENGGRRPFRPAPAFRSAEEAGEMVELYWMSLLRDVAFDEYDANPIAQQAAADLSNMSDFRGPKVNNRVTTQTLFRDNFPGCTIGPYVSQFLLRGTSNSIPGVPDVPAGVQFGAQRLDQRIRNYAAGTDYLTQFADWLSVQNGCVPSLGVPFDNNGLTYLRNGRGMGQYVRLDVLYQAYFVAALVLIDGVTLNETTSPFVFRFPFDQNNPYGRNGSTVVQGGFGQFGNPHIMTLVTEPSTRALKAVWFQKWRYHRRLRPEAFGGRVEVMRQGRRSYPIHADLLNRSSVLPLIFNKFGSYLLPQAFPEGSPMHPAYGSGHATVAGACVTMLKAFFDEDAVLPDARRVDPNNPGQLINYDGPALTVGGELNKLASNVAQARNIAGVHWRTDATEAIKLGEQVAINMLQDMSETYGEPFNGYSLTKFDGQRITVG